MGIFMPSSTLGDAREGSLELISPACTPQSRWIRFAVNVGGRLTCGYWPTTIETRNKYWHWCSSLCHGATSATLWRLCLVDALLVKRSTEVLCWVNEFCLYCPTRIFTRAALDGAKRNPDASSSASICSKGYRRFRYDVVGVPHASFCPHSCLLGRWP